MPKPRFLCSNSPPTPDFKRLCSPIEIHSKVRYLRTFLRFYLDFGLLKNTYFSLIRATPDPITRMEQTLRWAIWVEVNERKLIWHRAARKPWKTICWELGCDRSTAWRKWSIALAKITSRLNAGQKS